jgi:hypothetical protein
MGGCCVISSVWSTSGIAVRVWGRLSCARVAKERDTFCDVGKRSKIVLED